MSDYDDAAESVIEKFEKVRRTLDALNITTSVLGMRLGDDPQVLDLYKRVADMAVAIDGAVAAVTRLAQADAARHA